MPSDKAVKAARECAQATPAHELVVEKCWHPGCREIAVARDGAGWAWCFVHVDQEGVGGPLHSVVERLDVDYYQAKAKRMLESFAEQEREECAKVVDPYTDDDGFNNYSAIADAIRARKGEGA